MRCEMMKKGQLAMWVVIVLMGLMVSTPLMAEEDQREEGLQALRSANDAFDEEDFEQAYESYSKAFEILGIAQIKYRMGQSAHLRGEARKAVEHYEAYLEIGDDEEFVGRIEEALPELRAQLVTEVEVVTVPEGAEVVGRDGGEEVARGVAPTTWELEIAEVELEANLEGYDSAQETLALDGESQVRWEVELSEAAPEDDERVSDEPVMAHPAEVEDSSTRVMMGWTSTGVGVSILALGGVMSLLQSSATDDVNDFDRAAASANTQTYAERQVLRNEQEALRQDADNYHRAAMSAYVAGGVLTAAGLGILMSDWLSSDDEERDLSIDAGVSSEGGFFGVRGHF